jgi:DNA gyrase subunit A
VGNILAMDKDEMVRQILPAPIPVAEWGQWELLFATSQGLIKKSLLAAYANIRVSGLRAVDLRDGDDLIGVALLPILPEDMPKPEEIAATLADGDEGEGELEMVVPESEEELVEEESGETEDGGSLPGRPGRVMLFSRSGKAVRFRTNQVRRMGRVARGVRGMRLRGDDRVISLNVLLPGSGCQLLVVTERGFGKRTGEELFPTKGRGTQGVIGIITSERNGSVVDALTVWPGDQVMLITDQGTVLRTDVDSIRVTGRNAQGVKVLNVGSGERLVSVARLIADAEEGESRQGAAELEDSGVEAGAEED